MWQQCEPNLVVYGVWINTLDPRLPRICLFAARDINKGEELTFDYMMTGLLFYHTVFLKSIYLYFSVFKG